MYIDGQWTHAKSDAVFDVFNPATQDKISEVPDGGRDDADITAKKHLGPLRPSFPSILKKKCWKWPTTPSTDWPLTFTPVTSPAPCGFLNNCALLSWVSMILIPPPPTKKTAGLIEKKLIVHRGDRRER